MGLGVSGRAPESAGHVNEFNLSLHSKFTLRLRDSSKIIEYLPSRHQVVEFDP